MSDNARPEADQALADTSDELSDELSPTEQEKISGGDFLNAGGIKGESTQKPTGG